MTMTTYYTQGSVRGRCGHTHRTLSGAIRCLDRDLAGCKSQGGYSDRSVYRSDGELVPTLRDDRGHLMVDPYPGYGEEDSIV